MGATVADTNYIIGQPNSLKEKTMNTSDIPGLTALPSNWSENERGNTLLTKDDNLVAWIDLPSDCDEDDNQRLQVAYTPDNYPSLEVSIITLTEEELAKHIRTKCGGWFVQRLNVEGVQVENDEVVEEPDYSDMTTEDEHRILSEIITGLPTSEIFVGDVENILREELNNIVLAEIVHTFDTFDDAFEKMVHEMNPAGILSYGDVYSQLREHFNNEILDEWVKEQKDK